LVGVGFVPGLPELARPPRLAGTVEGRVIDQTGAGIGGASVTIRGTRLLASTGADGRYRLVGIPAEEVELIARAIGYRASAKTVRIREGAVTTADFTLTADPYRLEETIVSADGSRSKLGFAIGAVAAAPSIQRRGGGGPLFSGGGGGG